MFLSEKYTATTAYLIKLWRGLNDKTMPGTEKAFETLAYYINNNDSNKKNKKKKKIYGSNH